MSLLPGFKRSTTNPCSLQLFAVFAVFLQTGQSKFSAKRSVCEIVAFLLFVHGPRLPLGRADSKICPGN